MDQPPQDRPEPTPAARPSDGEARFRAVVDGFSDPLVIIDAFQIMRYANAEFLRAFGYQRVEVIGRPFDDVLPPAERPQVIAALASRPAAGALTRIEHHLIRHDRALEIVETNANRLDDPTGHDVVILHMRVMTERRWAEATLRASEERYRSLVENSHDLIQSVAPDGHLLFVNRAWRETLGYSEADLGGLRLWDIVHPDSREACEREFAALFQGQVAGLLRPTFIARSGAPVEVEGVAVVQWEDGRPIAISAFFRDVTEQRQHERTQALRLAFSRILAESPDLDTAMARVLEVIATTLGWQATELWLPDAAGAALIWHSGWRKSEDGPLEAFAAASSRATFSRGEGLPGSAWEMGEVIWEANLRESAHFRRGALAAAAGLWAAVAIPIVQRVAVVGVMLCYSRARRPVDPTLMAALADLGRQLGQFAARKQAEADLIAERASLAQRVEERTADLSLVNAELARAVRAKDEFLATMSHELRTPLNAILAFSEILLEQIRGPLNEYQQASVQGIEASGRHLLALINDILDLSKVEAGHLDLNLEPIAVADICQSSMAFVKELALKKQIQLAFHLNDQLAMLEADPRRLKQMLVNLLSNAVKFTPPGGKISLEVDVQVAAGTICFAVQDNGIGIASDAIPRLFQPFTQLDSSLSRQHEGTGLGLALVRRLALLHGGDVAVTSTVGQGSRFSITLPYHAPVEQEPDPAGPSWPGPAAQPVRTRSALIIDDSASASEQLVHYLNAMNLEVTLHSGGEGALDEVRGRRPDVILLDLLLPDQSGWEILAQLKTDPQTRDIPVIIVSVMDEQAKGLGAGAAAYLVKPITREALRKALRKASVPQLSLAPAPAPQPPPPEPAPVARLLLAEDTESTIQAVGGYLEDCGYQVLVARNGRQTIAQAEATLPDLILLDIQMPDLDGLEVARRLRSRPALATTPIIALTALAMAGDRERCLAAGADAYMTKPVSLKELAATIRRLLGR